MEVAELGVDTLRRRILPTTDGHVHAPVFHFPARLRSFALVPVHGQTPASPEFDKLVAQAVQLHQAGDLLGAVDAYTAALRIQPDHPGVRSNLGAAYVKLGKYDEAIEQYRAAIRADGRQSGLPVQPRAGLLQGRAFAGSG